MGRRRPLQGVTGPRRVLAGLRGAGPGVPGTPGTCHRMGPLLGPSPHPSPLSPIPRSPTPTRTPLARRVSLQAQSNQMKNSLSLSFSISLLFPPYRADKNKTKQNKRFNKKKKNSLFHCQRSDRPEIDQISIRTIWL